MLKLFAVLLVFAAHVFAFGFSQSPCLAAQQSKPDSGSATELVGPITRDKMIANARGYAEHKWSARPENVFHGLDKNKNRVDTPDSKYQKGGFKVGEQNSGIPYKWGGFSAIEEFDEGIAEGKFAGHLPKKGSSPASPQAVGVDCSGLVARCWDLPRKHSTRSLGNICYALKSYDKLQPGDIINSFDGHVVIFESYANEEKTKVSVFEAGRTRVERSVYLISRLKERGFKPLRYKPLDNRWTKQSLAPASFTATTVASSGHFKSSGKTASSLVEPVVAGRMQRGDWARYRVGVGEESVRSVSGIDSEGTLIRVRDSRAGKIQWNERLLSANASFVETLIHLGGFNEDFGDLTVVESEVEPGHYRWDGHEFATKRVKLEINTTLLIRGTTYPVAIRLDSVISEQVPLAGILNCRYETTVGSGSKIIGKSVKQIDLIDFFKG